MENKKDQNKSYYERNRKRLLEKARIRATGKGTQEIKDGGSVLTLFESAVSHPLKKLKEKAKDNDAKRAESIAYRDSIFFLALVVLITGFLFHETAKFFFVLDKNSVGAYVKAAILEGSAFAFALMPARSRVGSAFNGVMVFLIYSFGIWAVSYPIMNATLVQEGQGEIQRKVISELEQEIARKIRIRDQYWGQDRTILARRYDQSLDVLRSRLAAERNNTLASPSVILVRGMLIAGVLFRVLSMVANFACLQVLRKRKTWDRGTSCPH